jgi:hypothetical protein
MKINFTRIIVFIFLVIVIFVSISPSSFAALRRVEECGIESYISKADPACGVASYISARSGACGVDLYNEKKSLECEGSHKETPEREFNSYMSCPDGWTYLGSRYKTVPCDPHVQSTDPLVFASYPLGNNIIAKFCNKTVSRCHIPEKLLLCRLPQFGVEKYIECRDPSHGVETYNTCSLPEFGVAKWNECEVRKTRAELTEYIQGVESNLDLMGKELIENSRNLLKLTGNEIGMACYIKRWESDPLYRDVIEELKTTQFPELFGVPYDPTKYDCSSPSELTLSTETCSDSTLRCKFQTGYNAAFEFFKSNKTEVITLLDDLVARTDSTYKTKLEELNSKLDSYYKS